MKTNQIKIFNIVLFVAYILFSAFQLGKFGYYASHRELIQSDIAAIVGIVESLTIFIVWFIFAMIFNSKKKFRIVSLVMFAVCSVLVLAQIYSKIKSFGQLFFPTDDYTPPFIDKFTSLFELCFIIVFALSFIAYFVVLIKRKHFQKSS